jgi:hypothetical protein
MGRRFAFDAIIWRPPRRGGPETPRRRQRRWLRHIAHLHETGTGATETVGNGGETESGITGIEAGSHATSGSIRAPTRAAEAGAARTATRHAIVTGATATVMVTGVRGGTTGTRARPVVTNGATIAATLGATTTIAATLGATLAARIRGLVRGRPSATPDAIMTGIRGGETGSGVGAGPVSGAEPPLRDSAIG